MSPFQIATGARASLALVGSNFLGNSWVKSGLLRAASKNARSRAPERSELPQTSKRGEWATVRLLLPPSGYAPEQKSGPQEVGLTAEGDNDALAGPFLG